MAAQILKAAYIVVSRMRVGWRERISVFAPNRTRESRRNFICFCLRVSQLDLREVMNHMHELHRTPGYQKSLGNQAKTKGIYLCRPGTSIKDLLITQAARSNFTSSTFPASDLTYVLHCFNPSRSKGLEKKSMYLEDFFSWQVHK